MLLTSLVAAALIAEPTDLSAELEEIRRNHDVASMVCAAYRDGELLGAGAAGWYSYEDTTPVTVDSKYHIGSCTKAMTAVLVGMLVDDGVIGWDTPIAEAMVGLGDEFDPHWSEVTVRDLLAHRAGIDEDQVRELMFLPWSLNVKEPPLTPRQQRREVAKALLERPAQLPGEEGMPPYEYSNFGYILAGVIVEEHLDQPWEAVVQERIFEPLGMDSAGFGPPGNAGELIEPVGHMQSDEWKPMLIHEGMPLPDNPPAYGPAGRVHASIIDWGRFVDDFEQGLDGEGKLLKQATYETIAQDLDGDGYALGWGVSERDWADGKTLSHAGSNTYWYCVTWIAPEKDLVLLCASNVPPNPGSTACDQAIGMMVGAFNIQTETDQPDPDQPKTDEANSDSSGD